MRKKFDLLFLLFKTVYKLEFKPSTPPEPLKMFKSNDPVVKEYEILIDIKESSEKFKIKADDNYKAILFRGAKTWHFQNPDELEKNENLLGAVTVMKKGEDAPKLSEDTFDAYLNIIKRPGDEIDSSIGEE